MCCIGTDINGHNNDIKYLFDERMWTFFASYLPFKFSFSKMKLHASSCSASQPGSFFQSFTGWGIDIQKMFLEAPLKVHLRPFMSSSVRHMSSYSWLFDKLYIHFFRCSTSFWHSIILGSLHILAALHLLDTLHLLDAIDP